MKRRSERQAVVLPWEQRLRWLRTIFSARQWKIITAAVVIITVVGFTWTAAVNRERTRLTRIQIANIKQTIAQFRQQAGRCPRSISELISPPPRVTPRIHSVPRDAWGTEIFIQCPSRYDEMDVDVISAGPSRSFFTDNHIY